MIVREMVRRCDYDPAWIELLQAVLNDEVTFHFASKRQREEARKMTETLWDLRQKSGYLSARILDYLDSDTIQLVDQAEIQELINSLPERPFKVLCVHDCFRCLPHYGNDLRWQYNNQLMLIAKSDMLTFHLNQLLKQPGKFGKLDPALFKDILKSEYALS